MKKYIIFAYEAYYPLGGLEDIHTDVNDFDEALTIARNLTNDFVEIVDRDTWDVLWDKAFND